MEDKLTSNCRILSRGSSTITQSSTHRCLNPSSKHPTSNIKNTLKRPS